MVVFRVIESWSVQNFSRDLPHARAAETGLICALGFFGRGTLFWVQNVDRRAVLRPNIVALTHPLGGIVCFPKRPQQGFVRSDGWIEYHPHDLRVSRTSGTHFFIRRIRRTAARIPYGGRINAW